MFQVSPAAQKELQRLQQRQTSASNYIRLSIKAGGCLGTIYDLRFDGSPQPGDQQVDLGLLRILIDSNSLLDVETLLIDYSEDLMGGGFRFENPKVEQTCGCGNSFAIASVD